MPKPPDHPAALVLPEGYVAPWRPHPNPMMKGVIIDSSVPHPKEVATAPEALVPLICALPGLLRGAHGPDADGGALDTDAHEAVSALLGHVRTLAALSREATDVRLGMELAATRLLGATATPPKTAGNEPAPQPTLSVVPDLEETA